MRLLDTVCHGADWRAQLRIDGGAITFRGEDRYQERVLEWADCQFARHGTAFCDLMKYIHSSLKLEPLYVRALGEATRQEQEAQASEDAAAAPRAWGAAARHEAQGPVARSQDQSEAGSSGTVTASKKGCSFFLGEFLRKALHANAGPPTAEGKAGRSKKPGQPGYGDKVLTLQTLHDVIRQHRPGALSLEAPKSMFEYAFVEDG